MDNSTYINTNIIKENINDINMRIKKISDIFNKTNNDVTSFKNIDGWSGRTSESFFLKYDTLKGNYDTIIDSLNKLSSFIKDVAEAYEMFDDYMYNKIIESDLGV